MMHELGHALAAVATGGEFIEFVYDYSEGGSSVTRGGNQFLIFNAGYLGSCLFGSLLLVLACRTDLDKLLTFLVGLSIGVLTFLYAGPTADRTFAYIVAVLAMFTAIQLPNIISEAILILVGLASNAYAFFDIMEDVIFKRNASAISDAELLANSTSIPAVVWGLLWLAVSFIVTIYFLDLSILGRQTEEEARDDDESCDVEAAE